MKKDCAIAWCERLPKRVQIFFFYKWLSDGNNKPIALYDILEHKLHNHIRLFGDTQIAVPIFFSESNLASLSTKVISLLSAELEIPTIVKSHEILFTPFRFA